MDDQPTCGKGLAEHSALPARMSDLIDALAEVLEFHQTTLDLTDGNARQENDAYVSLAKGYRRTASLLQATAREMAGYRDLPMGKHDMAAMAAPIAREVFEKYVQREEELLTVLQGAVDGDKKMLDEMRNAAS